MTDRQLEILQHALGVNRYGQIPRGHDGYYRNYFCAGGRDEVDCLELVSLGFMETFEQAMLPYYNCTVTEAGKQAMRDASPKPPKLSRSQRRYREFLAADSGESFMEWLMTRRSA